jgi:hypothetical protein
VGCQSPYVYGGLCLNKHQLIALLFLGGINVTRLILFICILYLNALKIKIFLPTKVFTGCKTVYMQVQFPIEPAGFKIERKYCQKRKS